MKIFNKLLNIIVVITLIITTFMPPITVHAQNMDLPYKVYMYYPSSTSDSFKEEVNSYNSYSEAKNKVDSINSKPNATAGIEYDGRVVYASYALALMDGTRGGRRNDDFLYNIYPNSNLSGRELTYLAGTWGVDAAFIDYDPNYNSVKVKISGVTGWVSINTVTIKPIAAYYGKTELYTNNSPKVYINTTECLNLRSSAAILNDNKIVECAAQPQREYSYQPEKTTQNEGYTWYYVNINGTNGYIASQNGEDWVVEKNTLLTDTFYFTYQNEIYHNIHMGLRYYDYQTRLGDAPKDNDNKYYLKNNFTTNYLGVSNRYLSFDGNYFYTDFKDMIDDYRNDTYEHAINYEYPYYSYFMYMPVHTKTNMTAETINNSLIAQGLTALTHDTSYYYDLNGNVVNPMGSESILYNSGELFINAANNQSISPLSMYSAAMRESGRGTSAIALVKKNLFGWGAVDGDAFNRAASYNSIEESINFYANVIGGQSGYTNINDYRYHGTHKGNKSSGTVVYYMSDPYGGEKDSSFSYETDKMSGSTEIYYNTLGIKNNKNLVSIYKNPSKDSGVIYETKNYATGFILENLSFIVLDKVYTFENGKNQGYYKVYTDLSLDKNKNICTDCKYSFENSIGYIKEEDLYVQNNQPVITANDITLKQFEELDPLDGVTATDKEDGNITNITPTSNVDLTKIGEYSITYTVKDSSNFSASKTIKVTVLPTDAPIIDVKDITISAYKTFDPKKNVKVTDNHYGDITSKLEVVENNVNINKTGIYTVKYRATNDSNITTNKTIKVTVIANQKPVINASNILKYVDDSFDPLEGVTATDKEDGNLTNITYTHNVDTSKVGDYLVTYKVKDLDNQETTKSITVTVEEKEYVRKENVFYLDKLLYNEETKKVDFQGFLIIKGMNNNLDTTINYSVIFENQDTNGRIIKPLSRLTTNMPFNAPNVDNYTNQGSWFTSNLDLTDLDDGDYNVYVRARSGNYEALVNLKNILFNSNVSKKFSIDGTGYQFRINYFSKALAMELMVRKEGLVASKNTPTIDNMYNQIYSISLENTKLSITASSHNVGGDYGKDSNVERYMTFENVVTKEKYLTKNIGYVLDGPYKISLKVDDGYDKTKAWYRSEIDLKDLPKGIYSIIVRTKTKDIDDYGEVYDIINSNLELSSNTNGKKISIRVNKSIRYRIEITVE